jgi:hypothetical protein
MKEKTYKICITRSNSDKENVVEGTLEVLMNMFGRDIFNGNQLNPKIKVKPQNIKEFMTALQKSYNELEKNVRSQTFVDLIK